MTVISCLVPILQEAEENECLPALSMGKIEKNWMWKVVERLHDVPNRWYKYGSSCSCYNWNSNSKYLCFSIVWRHVSDTRNQADVWIFVVNFWHHLKILWHPDCKTTTLNISHTHHNHVLMVNGESCYRNKWMRSSAKMRWQQRLWQSCTLLGQGNMFMIRAQVIMWKRARQGWGLSFCQNCI